MGKGRLEFCSGYVCPCIRHALRLTWKAGLMGEINGKQTFPLSCLASYILLLPRPPSALHSPAAGQVEVMRIKGDG